MQQAQKANGHNECIRNPSNCSFSSIFLDLLNLLQEIINEKRTEHTWWQRYYGCLHLICHPSSMLLSFLYGTYFILPILRIYWKICLANDSNLNWINKMEIWFWFCLFQKRNFLLLFRTKVIPSEYKLTINSSPLVAVKRLNGIHVGEQVLYEQSIQIAIREESIFIVK